MKNELLTQYKKATLFYKNKLSCIISFDNAPFTTIKWIPNYILPASAILGKDGNIVVKYLDGQ